MRAPRHSEVGRPAGLALAAMAIAAALSCAEDEAKPPVTPATAAPPGGANPAAAAAAPAEAKPSVDLSYWNGRKDLITAPAAPQASELKLPAIERFKLGNGLDVIVVPRSELPVVSFSMAIKAGSYDDDKSKQGVADFTASMLRKGTRTRKADDISRAIDFVGGSLGTGAGAESSSAECTALSRDRKLCLDLLSDILLNPTFPEDEMAEIRDQMVAGLQGRFDSPQQLAGEHFSNLLFGEKHPDGWVMVPEDVKKITRDQLLEFWKTYYRPNNAVLAIAGDVEPATLKADLEKAFGAWEASKVAARTELKVPERKGTRILLVDKDDLNQATIVFGHKGIKHADPDWYAASMVNYALGGSDFSSRLMKEVRSKQGLTYGISSSFGASLYEGAFRVSFSTKNASAWPALESAVREITRMKTEGPTEEEMSKAKGYYAGSYPFRLQSAEGIAGSIVAAELHGLGIPYVKQFVLRMAKVDVGAAKAAAAELLQPENLVVVIVGKASEIEPQLQKTGFKYEKINYKEPISVAVRVKARKDAEAAMASGEGGKALTLVKRGLDAQGGEAAMRAIRDVKMEKTGVLKSPDGDADLASTIVYQLPGRARVDMEIMVPQGTQQQVFVITPEAVKVGGRGALRAVPKQHPMAAALRGSLYQDNNLILLNIVSAKPPLAMQLLPDVSDGGRALQGISVKTPDGDTVKLYFDGKSGLLSRMVTTEQGREKTESYDDYKAVGNVKLAHKIHSTGGTESEETVKSVKINAGVDPKTFE